MSCHNSKMIYGLCLYRLNKQYFDIPCVWCSAKTKRTLKKYFKAYYCVGDYYPVEACVAFFDNSADLHNAKNILWDMKNMDVMILAMKKDFGGEALIIKTGEAV